MDLLHRLLTAEPLLALFLTIALGYLVGKLKAGNFVLGGIAGTLLVGNGRRGKMGNRPLVANAGRDLLQQRLGGPAKHQADASAIRAR
jgi:hypothetical protein